VWAGFFIRGGKRNRIEGRAGQWGGKKRAAEVGAKKLKRCKNARDAKSRDGKGNWGLLYRYLHGLKHLEENQSDHSKGHQSRGWGGLQPFRKQSDKKGEGTVSKR